MRIPWVFAIVLVGGSTIAAAQPKPKENTERLSYNERTKPPKHDSPRTGDWVQLATPTPASNGTEFVVVGRDAGAFSRLRIDPSDGKVIVRRVRIYFEDGKEKLVTMNKVIDAARNNPALIDLDAHKAIDRIVVTTEPYTRGSYAIYGTAGTGGVARR